MLTDNQILTIANKAGHSNAKPDRDGRYIAYVYFDSYSGCTVAHAISREEAADAGIIDNDLPLEEDIWW